MAKLHAAQRNSLPKSEFALPEQRKYPVNDKNHARVAKSYASKEEHAGVISESTKEKIDRKANSVLGHKNVKNPGSHAAKMKHE